MQVIPAQGCRDTFERLKSNAIGDSYVDPGQYFLRKDTKRAKTSEPVFRPNGGHKLVRHSEFKHMHNGPPLRPTPEQKKNFLTRFTYETSQKKIPYTEDLFENKEDMVRDDYIRRRSQIMYPSKPYTSTVKQRGTFYSERLTYGEDREFPAKAKQQKMPPNYGPFKV